MFGEKIIDTAFKDTVIDAMLSTFRQNQKRAWYGGAGVEAVITLYDGTPKGSKGRQLFAEHAADFMPIYPWVPVYPYEFLHDILVIHTRKRSMGALLTEEFEHTNCHCRYHEHKDDEDCTSTDDTK